MSGLTDHLNALSITPANLTLAAAQLNEAMLNARNDEFAAAQRAASLLRAAAARIEELETVFQIDNKTIEVLTGKRRALEARIEQQDAVIANVREWREDVDRRDFTWAALDDLIASTIDPEES